MHGAKGDFILPIQPIWFEDIRLVPENVVMVATDKCKKSPLWGNGYTGLCENIHF